MKKILKKIKDTLIDKIADIGGFNFFIILFAIGFTIFTFIKKDYSAFALCMWVWIAFGLLAIASLVEDFFEDLKFKKDLQKFEDQDAK